MIRQLIRRSALLLLIAAFVLSQVTWALAGTTGGISGTVTDESGAPVAGASIKVISASQAAGTTSDATGHFNFLSLAPDTYTVSIEKDSYSPLSYAGVTVFADNQLALSFKMQKALKTIAKVTARAAGDLVKAGVGSDVYNVNTAAMQASAAIGGGGSLNSAYSAMASVPGVVIAQGNAGWNQGTFVRGSQSFFTGFEYDGIPVNRAFDNYNASTESSVGLQELQVYTGGGPASNSSSGTSGFINQVFKTGTYPGYGTLTGGIGGPTFYHQAKVEAGGASPDRRFSYYLGLSGYNQEFRIYDNNNGGALTNDPQGVYTGQSTANVSGFGLYGECNTTVAPGTAGFDPNTLLSAAGPNWYKTSFGGGSNCLIPFNGIYSNGSQITDRETVANFHFRIPRKNGTSDDLQLLGSASSLNSQAYSSPNDVGGYANYTLAVTGNAYCNPQTSIDAYGRNCTPTYGGPSQGGNYPAYVDAHVYNAPFGTNVAGMPYQSYYQPASNTNRPFGAEIEANHRDANWNDTGIVKLQYTHQLSPSAFARVFGYTFFSDWTQAGANDSFNSYLWGIGGPGDTALAAHYDLITHTAGGELQLVDQVNAAHLLELTANYTTANVIRFNDSGFTGLASPVGLVANATSGAGATCFNATTMAPVGCYSSSSHTAISATGTYPAITGAAAAAGAQWVTLWDGPARGSYNTVKPRFAFVSLSDQWRPTDKLLLNASLRYDGYLYGLVSNPGPAAAFFGAIIDKNVCVNASGQVYSTPIKPNSPPPAAPIYVPNNQTDCPAGYGPASFNVNSPGSYSVADLSPRLSATYTQSPDTVWRASLGRFSEPPISASLQYLNISGDNRSIWTATLPLGFNTPFHPIPPQSATQADLSLEHHIRGTDMSFKLTPFYNYTVGYQEQAFIGPNFVTQTPVGNFRSIGAEFAFTKGDFSKDGLSGQLSVAYNNARVQATNWFGNNQYVSVNQAISEFNKLTATGDPISGVKGSPYYCAGVGVSSPTAAGCTAGNAIANPYYNMPTQSLVTINGWYPGANTGISPSSNQTQTYFDTPWNTTMILNYRKNKLAITPSLQLNAGPSYGEPLDISGYDPRTCAQNSSAAGSNIVALSPGTNPYQCDYSTVSGTQSTAAGRLFIPNPNTGSFDSIGQYRSPWELGVNLAVTYDLSPKVKLNLTAANIYHTCFGGSKTAWTTLYSPDKNTCIYGQNPFYVSNYYNGTSMFDSAANGLTPQKFAQQPYGPIEGTVGSIPMNLYFSVDIKL